MTNDEKPNDERIPKSEARMPLDTRLPQTARKIGWLGLGMVLLAGCGPSSPAEYAVSGSVTWNGDQLPEGDILFTPVDGQGVPHAGKIAGGEFRLKATAGPKKVSIFATREVGPPDPEMGARPREMYVPERYNHATTLTAEVTADGDNRFDLALQAED